MVVVGGYASHPRSRASLLVPTSQRGKRGNPAWFDGATGPVHDVDGQRAHQRGSLVCATRSDQSPWHTRCACRGCSRTRFGRRLARRVHRWRSRPGAATNQARSRHRTQLAAAWHLPPPLGSEPWSRAGGRGGGCDHGGRDHRTDPLAPCLATLDAATAQCRYLARRGPVLETRHGLLAGRSAQG